LGVFCFAHVTDGRDEIAACTFFDFDADGGALQALIEDALHGRSKVFDGVIVSSDV
jgi:hypothetical protein